jgi:hypothetical protein
MCGLSFQNFLYGQRGAAGRSHPSGELLPYIFQAGFHRTPRTSIVE